MSNEPAPSGLEETRPVSNPWLIAATVMSVTFMEVLDTSVANVALPHIAGSLAASADESTWVLTSYLVSNAIAVVAAGWLSSFFGRKRLVLSCVLIFTVASALCGAAPSLGGLILARVIQGIGGGLLQPTAQAVLLETFPPDKRGWGMAVYTMGILVAPLTGPTVGGWIADNWSWRWVFYINLPVGILAMLMTQSFITDPPHLRGRVREHIDYVGFALMATGVGALQIIFDKGQQEDWFSSALIRNLSFITIGALALFIFHELRAEAPIVDLRVLRNRNFAISALLVMAVAAAFYGTIALLPIFLQTALGYTAELSGQTLMPRAIGSLAAMLIVGRLIGKIDSRLMVVCGFGLLSLSVYLLGDINLDVSSSTFFWPSVINGFANGLVFTPLTTAAVSTLRTDEIGNATGIFSLMRNLGGGFGISSMTTLLTRREQWRQTVLASHLTPYNRAFRQRIQQLQSLVGEQQAYKALYSRLLKHATLLAFIDVFRILALLYLLCAPLPLLFKIDKRYKR